LIDATLNDAFGQRQVTQYYTQVNSYAVILEVLQQLRRDPKAIETASGQPVQLPNLVDVDTRRTGPLSVNHQRQFPAVTLSFNLPQGVALGQAVAAIDRAQAELGALQSLTGTFAGNAQAFRSSLANEPVLIASALSRLRHPRHAP
jgi:multidrug efflux pump subunit AcrB